MAKEQLKNEVIKAKGKKCSLTNKPLPADKSLFDTHRTVPKKDNGDYTLQNTGVVLPIDHMKKHGTYRERTEDVSY